MDLISNSKEINKEIKNNDIVNKEIINNKRKGFISQLLDDWYNGGISKYGSLSKYNFN